MNAYTRATSRPGEVGSSASTAVQNTTSFLNADLTDEESAHLRKEAESVHKRLQAMGYNVDQQLLTSYAFFYKRDEEFLLDAFMEKWHLVRCFLSPDSH